MNEILGLSLEALHVDDARLASLSSNLANAMTPGYKREVSIQHAAPARSFSEVMASQSTRANAPGKEVTAAVELLRDMRVGTLRTTGQPLDFALTGPGFFEVATPAGPAYTRHGQFQLDARGRVITAQGFPVMGTGGEIVLTGAPTVDSTGAFTEEGRVVARLRLVNFQSPERLERTEGGFAAAGVPQVLDDGAVQVRQGQLENANVDTTREMVDLIKTMRHFESMQRAVQAYDEMLGTGIRKLGDI
jgi:flagellar basal-body rod protein FlgF